MLALRFAIVASLAAVSLWALFSLLDTLREPELLRSSKAVVVKGCDPIDTAAAAQACSHLFCQKALLDTKQLPIDTRFEVQLERHESPHRLVAGSASAAGSELTGFVCLLEHEVVTEARLVQLEELEALSESESW